MLGTTHILAWFDMSGYLKRSTGSEICKCSSMHVSGFIRVQTTAAVGDGETQHGMHHSTTSSGTVIASCCWSSLIRHVSCSSDVPPSAGSNLAGGLLAGGVPFVACMSLSSKRYAAQAEVCLGCPSLNVRTAVSCVGDGRNSLPCSVTWTKKQLIYHPRVQDSGL